MCQTALDMPDQAVGKPYQPAGQVAAVHDGTGQDIEWDREDGKGIQPAEHLGNQHRDRDPLCEHHHKRGNADRERYRHTNQQQDDKDGKHQQDIHGVPPFRAGLPANAVNDVFRSTASTISFSTIITAAPSGIAAYA